MKPLESLDDILGVLGKSCPKCHEIGWGGTYGNVQIKNTGLVIVAVYRCSFSSIHEHTIQVAFETSKNDIEKITKEMQEFRRNLKPYDTYSKSEREDVRRTSSELYRKLQLAAKLAPTDLKMEFDGYCEICFAESPIKIEKSEVSITCSPCATMIADSYD